jgi:hypothetical protein
MSAPEPYINTNPGELITAQLFNGVQSAIKEDIADQVKKAIAALKSVDNSGDSAKLGGKTPKELEDAIVQRALAEIPKRTGYKMFFRALTEGQPEIIKHDLKTFPLVDVYQLDYFEALCAESEDKEDWEIRYVNFYLYHTDEKEIRTPGLRGSGEAGAVRPAGGGSKNKIVVEPADGNIPFKICFEEMLHLVGVTYVPTQSIGDVVTEFWDKFFGDHRFGQEQFGHSPWFERCCGENRSIGTLKERGNWDEIWFQMRPIKTINFPDPPLVMSPPEDRPAFPNNIAVAHVDFNNIAVGLMGPPHHRQNLVDDERINKDEIKVMLLLKV